jgi:hypothetical protein
MSLEAVNSTSLDYKDKTSFDNYNSPAAKERAK